MPKREPPEMRIDRGPDIRTNSVIVGVLTPMNPGLLTTSLEPDSFPRRKLELIQRENKKECSKSQNFSHISTIIDHVHPMDSKARA